jgi:hypothetical protein
MSRILITIHPVKQRSLTGENQRGSEVTISTKKEQNLREIAYQYNAFGNTDSGDLYFPSFCRWLITHYQAANRRRCIGVYTYVTFLLPLCSRTTIKTKAVVIRVGRFGSKVLN